MTLLTLDAPSQGRAQVQVRDADGADNDELVRLAAACPMRGDVGLCVDRAPDFFALNRLEGNRWRVGVATVAGDVVGCVAAAQREAWLNGEARRTGYVSDLKVHPAHRGSAAADLLEEYARTACRGFGGGVLPVLLTILAGNRSMERRAGGMRGLPRLTRVGTVRTHAIPLLWRRPSRVDGVHVSSATVRDLEEMGALWSRVARERQFAPVLDAASLAAWIDDAPGLALGDYLVARDTRGTLLGFLALWDQRAFKQLRVTGYSRRLAAVRAVVNAAAPLMGATPLPAAGEPLACRTIVHPCVAREAPHALRALLLGAYHRLHGSGTSFFTIGLDVRDPLSIAVRGLAAQPTDVHVYVTSPRGDYLGPRLDGRPIHFEVALV